MDTTAIRLISQVALVAWCTAEIAVLLLSRGHWTPVVGIQFAIAGLICFAAWMFLSALTIRAIELISREHVVWIFALLEAGTAIGAWLWLIASVRSSFRFSLRLNGTK